MHAKDVVYIPKKPNAVRVGGEVNNPGILGYIDGDNLWDYVDRAGGLTDSVQYILLTHPNGNTEKFTPGLFSGSSTIYDGSIIIATKIPPPVAKEKSEDLFVLIRDLFALTASLLTVLVLAKSL
jgi:protein involved in polysaccharide export with SLBB domain